MKAPPQAAAISKKLLRDEGSNIIKELLDQNYTLFKDGSYRGRIQQVGNDSCSFQLSPV
jgi:hypothetical protein